MTRRTETLVVADLRDRDLTHDGEVPPRHLDAAGAARRIEGRLGAAVPDAAVDLICRETGGLTALVDDVVEAWRDDPPTGRPREVTLPPGVVERVGRSIRGLDPLSQSVLHMAMLAGDVDAMTVAMVMDVEDEEAVGAIEAARAAGLLLADGRVPPLVVRALGDDAGGACSTALPTRLLRARATHGLDALPLARSLARAGVGDSLVGDVLVQAGDRRRSTDPAGASALYAEAVQAGFGPAALAVRRAECAARCAQYGAVLALVEDVLAHPEHPEVTVAVDVAAVAWSHEGQLHRAAELYRWLGTDRLGPSAAMAAFTTLATGRRLDAVDVLNGEPPTATLAGGMGSLMARGLLESVAGDGRRALSTLMRATAMQELDGPAPLLVETPAVVAALMALHLGDLDVAESALARGVDGGAGASGVRHRLLVGWTAMLRGRYSRARELLSAARSDAGRLALRDELLARALAVGLARRTSDVAALVTAWRSGWDVLLRHPVDLFTLLPLGEFAVASARLREFERVEPHLDDARSLLSALGEPATWSPALDWSLLQAAILRNRPDEVEPHARALVAAAPRSDFAAALAAAGRAWMQVLTTRFATPEVEQAAQRLQRFGLAWDGSRLLGQAAAHTSDRRRIAYLLHAARALQEPDDPRPTEGPAGAERAAPAVLSTREMEIAELLVQQRTYREIGDELFISPKTVEHHVARIKQRLGVSDRADLLARLRAPSATG